MRGVADVRAGEEVERIDAFPCRDILRRDGDFPVYPFHAFLRTHHRPLEDGNGVSAEIAPAIRQRLLPIPFGLLVGNLDFHVVGAFLRLFLNLSFGLVVHIEEQFVDGFGVGQHAGIQGFLAPVQELRPDSGLGVVGQVGQGGGTERPRLACALRPHHVTELRFEGAALRIRDVEERLAAAEFANFGQFFGVVASPTPPLTLE